MNYIVPIHTVDVSGEELIAATTHKKPDRREPEAAIRTLIWWAGDDPHREGLHGKPDRVVRWYEEFITGYVSNPIEILGPSFEETDGYDEIVLLKSVECSSHCNHHMVPIIGFAHVAHISNNRVVGISK